MHTQKSTSDVGKETKQRRTGKEQRGERIATGNRRRGINDNVECDWEHSWYFCTGFCMERQIFSCTHTVLWLMTFTVTQSAVSPWLASNKTPWVERITSFTLCRCVCVCVHGHTHTCFTSINFGIWISVETRGKSLNKPSYMTIDR